MNTLVVHRLSYNNQAGCTISRPAAEKMARLPYTREIIPTKVPTISDLVAKGINKLIRGAKRLLGQRV